MQDDNGLLQRYAAGQRNFSGTDLRGIKLCGSRREEIDLSGADFSYANLEGANLKDVILNQVNFSDANLKGAQISGKINNSDFSRADLTNAIVAGTQLHETQFREANLTNASFGFNSLGYTKLDFSNANCTQTKLTCVLSEANFQGANVKHAIFRNPANLSYVSLKAANLSGLDLSGQNFLAVHLNEANLSGSNLARANLKRANLEAANLQGANLEGADLTEANLRNTQIEGAIALDPNARLVWQVINQKTESQILQRADLRGADLKETNLSGFDLSEANLQRANLTGANLSHANLSGANLSRADLSYANLAHANLHQARLSRAKLIGANLDQANLNQADLVGAVLAQAVLRNATLQNANLTDAGLHNTDFTDADLSDADVSCTLLAKTKYFSDGSNHPHQALLNQIRAASEGLRYPSESDAAYEVFLWETGAQGDLTLEGLLKAFGHVRELSADAFRTADLNDPPEWLQPVSPWEKDLRQNQELVQGFRALLNQVAGYLTNVQILRLATVEQYFYMVLAQTPSDDWLGISTKASSHFEQQRASSPIFLTRDLAIFNPENRDLIVALETAIAGVQFSSEYLEGFVWEIAEQRSAVFHNLLDTVNLVVTKEVQGLIKSVDEDDEDNQDNQDNSNEDEDENEDDSEDSRYREPIDRRLAIVVEQLKHLRLYRVYAGGEEYNLKLYYVGQTENGDWIVLQTAATET